VIQGPLSREEEGSVLRGLLGMLVKKRTADADMLEYTQDGVRDFLKRYTVGVTKDDVSGRYLVVIQQRVENGQELH
jgi:hypothetical protein